jgi:cholera toxin transcriptional activator
MSSGAKAPISAQRFRFGIYEADARTGELLRDGIKVKLQEQPFQVLLTMLERPGEVITREELRERLWPADTFVDFDHGLNTAINKLREALRDSAANPRFIETRAKRGYRFIAPVQVIVNGAASAEKPVLEPLPTALPDLPQVHRGWTRTLMALLQIMYLTFYVVALARIGDLDRVLDRFFPGRGTAVTVLALVTACLGIPVRLYLLSAVAFDYRRTGEKFLRMFPFVMVLDFIWALAPFLCVEDIGIGLAFAVTAALLYAPFSQRTLVRMSYPQSI